MTPEDRTREALECDTDRGARVFAGRSAMTGRWITPAVALCAAISLEPIETAPKDRMVLIEHRGGTSWSSWDEACPCWVTEDGRRLTGLYPLRWWHETASPKPRPSDE